MRSKAVWRMFLCMACVVVLAAQVPIPQEYQVKAALIYNLAKFVEWPAVALPETSTDMALCIVGEDPFGPDLDHTIAGKSVHRKRLTISRLRTVQDVAGCHIVFIGMLARPDLVQTLDAAQDSHALTIGETDQFTNLGGMIFLTMEGNRVQFEVNMEAVERAKLRISSKALKLARAVKGGELN
jgi:hypothetical protein